VPYFNSPASIRTASERFDNFLSFGHELFKHSDRIAKASFSLRRVGRKWVPARDAPVGDALLLGFWFGEAALDGGYD
jgi:hypothetical protein